MKYLLICLMTGVMLLGVQQLPAAAAEPATAEVSSRTATTWGWIALGMGVASVVTIALPYLSLPGLLLGIGAVVIARIFRKKMKYPGVARLAAGLGGLSIVFFLLALGLILFF